MTNNKVPRTIMLIGSDVHLQRSFGAASGSIENLAVHASRSGWEALAMAPRLLPDLILIDANMLGLDGPATLIMLRRLPALQRIAAIFMTGPGEKAAPACYAMRDVLGIIVRPADPHMLLARVRELWEGRATVGKDLV